MLSFGGSANVGLSGVRLRLESPSPGLPEPDPLCGDLFGRGLVYVGMAPWFTGVPNMRLGKYPCVSPSLDMLTESGGTVRVGMQKHTCC